MEEIVKSFENVAIVDDYQYTTIVPRSDVIQKCFIPGDLFIKLKMLPGSLVKVLTQRKTFILKAYPYSVNSHCIRLCPIVSVTDNMLNIKNSIRKCSIEHVQRLSTFSSIEVDVVYNTNFYASKDIHMEHISCLARHILTNLVFCSNSTVDLEGLHFPLTYGIKKIMILKTSKNQCGSINENTKICVSNVINDVQFNKRMALLRRCFFGMNRNLREILDIFDANLLYQKLEKKILPPIKQLLLAGPTGSGKTTLVEEACKICKNMLLKVRGQDIYGKEVGLAELQLNAMFEEAFSYTDSNELSVVLLEDIDLVCPNTKNTSQHSVRLSTHLMSLLDRCQETCGIIVIATSNNPTDINPSLRRQGRLAKEIYIGKLSQPDRTEIIYNFCQAFSAKLSITMDVSSMLGSITQGYVIADLKHLCQMACTSINKEELCNDDKVITIFKDILTKMKPQSLRNDIEIVPAGQNLAQIGGMENVKKQIEQIIKCVFVYPDMYRRLGIMKPKGFLLYGPPGCAKTTLVKALAAMGNITVLCASSAYIYSPYVGDAEKALLWLFATARQNAPAIIFLDEIDSIIGSRFGNHASNVQERVLAALLMEMDGIGITMQVSDYNKNSSDGDDVLVIAATNRPTEIDPALLRPGRFDRHIYVSAPDYDSRLDILKLITQNTPMDEEFNLEAVAAATEYYSGADLKNLHSEAVLQAMKEDGVDVPFVKQSHYLDVLKTIRPSLNHNEVMKYKNIKFV